MVTFKVIEEERKFDNKEEVTDFLHEHLDEYRDSKKDIEKAINYAFSKSDGKGGFLLETFDDEKLIGCVVINNSGMSGYIPEHVLVYIAVHKDNRGKGIGRMMLKKIFKLCKGGNISLHVEYENPAKRLYERVGFTSKYAEMRYKNK